MIAPSLIPQPVLSFLKKPEDVEKKEKPLSEDEQITKQVDADIASVSSAPLKEDDEIAKQVDADIAAAKKPPEELDAFGYKKDPVTKGIEYLQSGIQGMIGKEEKESPFVNELSENLKLSGPNKIDQYDKDLIATLDANERKDLLERHPWVYATLTPAQKEEQFKLSRESNVPALTAVGRAIGQVGNFGLDLVKAGWNVGLDTAYAEVAAPLWDAWEGKSQDLVGPRQQKAREKVTADLRNAEGAWMNSIIESQRQIEKFTGINAPTSSEFKPKIITSKQPELETAARLTGAALGISPLFLATKLAEASKDPNSGYAAFVDHLNEKLGFQNESMSKKHYDNRKLYEAEKSAEDWNAGQGAELVSPWSKAAYNPAFQYLNLQREAWMLPSAKTYAKLKGISEEQAQAELANKASQNADKNLRELTTKWNKEYDPSMELLGGMFLGDAALDVAGIAIGGARLASQGIKALETAGMSPAAINALRTAQQARQREVLAQQVENAQKRSLIGKAAKGTEEFQKAAYEKGAEFIKPVSEAYEKLPEQLRGLIKIGGLGTAGAYAGSILDPENQQKGILSGLGVAGALGAVPGLIRSVDEARMIRAGGSPLGEGLFETAGKAPTSTFTTKLLFGGKRGPVADYIADNFHTLGKAGINFAAINAVNSTINSDSPEKFIDSVAEGFAMGVGFKLAGKIHGSDPETELNNRKRKDVEIYLSRQRQSDPTRENMDSLRNYQNYVDSSQANIEKMQEELVKAQQSGDQQKIATAQKAVDVAETVHNQILSANLQTRNEMGRMMDEIYSDGNSLINGARKVGQQNVQLEVLTTPQIVELLSKQFPEKSADELVFMATQRGFFIKDTNTSVVNFDRIRRRQQMFGESITDAFRHELGHAIWSIKEFRDLNKTADDLLFDRVQRNLNGEIIDLKPGKFSEDDLFKLYTDKYLKNKTPEEINQYAQESGLWNYKTNSLDRQEVIDYMKDEVRAELISGNLAQGYGKLKQQSRSIDDWVSLRGKTNLLARAMQNAAGLGAKPFESKLLGVTYDPEIVAANRKAIEAMRKYNGEFEEAPETKKGQEITEKTMRNDPVMRKRYGLNGGEYQTALYAEVRDADGKIVGQKVPVTSEVAKEGTWVNDVQTGQTKQTKGYGQVPPEFAEMQIPAGGSLNIVTDFVYEPDGKTPVRRKDKDIEKLDEDRRIAIKNAVDSASDRYSDPRWFKPYSKDGESYDGLFSPEQIKNIKNLPESVLPLSIKEKIIALNDLMLMGDGSTIEIDYAARLKGKKYKGRRSEIYSLIPGGKFQLSKETNFTFNAVSRGAWLRKMKARKDRMPGWFTPWGNDTGLFERELQEKYLANTYAKRPGWYGLDPENPTEKTPLAEEKWNKFKDFLNMVAKDVPTVDNPWRMKTPSAKGKEGRAEGDIDNLWRKFRLDAIADWADSTDATGRYQMGWENIYKQLLPTDEAGEPTEFRTPEQQRRGGVSAKFMPERMEGEATTQQKLQFMPERPVDQVAAEQGFNVKAYHGTSRADRVGNRFRKTRATSGPMAFFTSDPNIAENYSKGKADTSIEPPEDYRDWFKFKPAGSKKEVNISDAWYSLTPEQRRNATEKLYTTGYENADEGTGAIIPNAEFSIAGKDSIDYELRKARGNALEAAKELWLTSGTLFNDEVKFTEVLKSLGVDARFDDPFAKNPKVYDVFLKIQNPLVTSEIPENVMEALRANAKKQRKPSRQFGADAWDKRTVNAKDWIAELDADYAAGRNSFAWTRIPDWVTNTLKSFGYDSIHDTGGKMGGEGHDVYIPFEENQIKSAAQETFTDAGKKIPMEKRFSEKPDIRFMPERPAEERIVSATYTDPRTGEVREGVNHKAANPNAPDEQTDRESRYYGFKTDTGRVVDREEAYRIAEAYGQLKDATSEEDRFNADRGVLHSNMVEMEPTIGEKTEISPKIDENTGLPLNPDGTVTLYHGTTKDSARKIIDTGLLKSTAEPDVYFTTAKDGTGYGDGTVIAVNIDPKKLIIDDEFPDGRKDFRVPVGKLKQLNVSAKISEPTISEKPQSSEMIGADTIKPADIQPSGGIQFMPERPVGKTEPLPDFETTIIKGVTPRKGFNWKKATNVEFDIGGGRKMSFSYDPKVLTEPVFKDLIKELKGQPVILLEADRQRATGGDMGGPLHPFLKSNQVTITGPDGIKYKAVWANMTSGFVSGAKNRLASHGAKYALVHLMDSLAHKSNKRTARTLDKMMRKSKLDQNQKEIISLAMQNGIIAGQKAALSASITAAKRRFKDATKEDLLEINKQIDELTKERDSLTPQGIYAEIFDAVSKIKTASSNVKTGRWKQSTVDKAIENLKSLSKTKEYKELLNKNKSLYISDNIGNTFSDRGSAIGSILSFKFGKFDPSYVMRESSDFKEGQNLDIVTAVELSQNPDIFALYFGNDPKEEAAMSPAERKARDEMRANPEFVEHEAYDWVMLGPEKGNNFLVEKPVKPEEIFKKYRDVHEKDSVKEGSEETVAGAMRKFAGIKLIVDEDAVKVNASTKSKK